MVTENAEDPETDHLEKRHDFVDFIRPGLYRLEAGVASNPQIGASRVFCRAVVEHLLKLLEYEPMMFPEFINHRQPLYWLPQWYLDSVRNWVLELESRILTISDEEAAERFASACRDALRAGDEALGTYKAEDESGRSFRFRLGQLQLALDQFKLQEAVAVVAETGARVNEIEAHAAEAAGGAASNGMATFFQQYAESERRRYRLWISALALAVVGSIALGGFVVAQMGNPTFNAEEFARLALALPALAFAAYASRQANYHRNVESSSRLVAVQLRTVSAFTDSLDSASRREIMRSLGQRVFSPRVEQSVVEATPSYGLPAEVVQVLQDILTKAKSDGK
ncbi:hypothetical protein ACWEOR_13820 [Micromonospora chalcea]|uniref:hypothetical protein n=1 Tax=Micromonospora sp. D75 TaxID=2824885 RepID=UPI001B37CDCC|nr:hypothetical protein [Micromonospora sp. D75]MBQ1068667.1 hypothetical protein [Micromonospora sp. D75]